MMAWALALSDGVVKAVATGLGWYAYKAIV